MKELITEWKQFLDKKIILEQNEEYLENEAKKLLAQGYGEVSEINLPDNKYTLGGGGYVIELMSPDGSQNTGYSIIRKSGIRGMYSGQGVVSGKKLGYPYSDVYKILFKNVGYKGQEPAPAMVITTKTSQQLPQEIIEDAAPPVTVKNGRGSFFLKGKYYKVDLSDIFSNINGNVEFISSKAEDVVKYIPDIKPGSIMIGFGVGDINNAYYINNSGSPATKAFKG
jgi:hypothetical protein